MISTRPYLVRAIYQWIIDNDLTPYVVINAEMPAVDVPSTYIEEGRIVLNVSPDATDQLKITNTRIEFDASFAGAVSHIEAPIKAILAIYARENGRGMVFNEDDDEDDGDDGGEGPPYTSGENGGKTERPKLRIVK